ncbi:MAG: hypothetical protein Q9216_006680 [Gyalolechia sp. 2 TL-2023]
MPSSRIANDLSDGGFDPEVHLKIAQESLRHMQDTVRGLPEIEKEYDEALRALKDAPAGPVKDRMTKLAEDMKELKAELEGAPGKITELEADIVMLRKYIAAGKEKGSQKNFDLHKANGGREI